MAGEDRILVVDGDPHWRQQIGASLVGLPVELGYAGSVREALELAEGVPPKLIVLDLCLPDVSGLGLCRLIREDSRLAAAGILMVTAYSSEIDRILAFEAGVDDFLSKPFSARELESRVMAVLRRTSSSPHQTESIADPRPLTAAEPAGAVAPLGDTAALTQRERELLGALARCSGRVRTRRQLLDEVWGPDAGQIERVVDAHVKAIRRKLGPARESIETVRGVGYRLNERFALADAETGSERQEPQRSVNS